MRTSSIKKRKMGPKRKTGRPAYQPDEYDRDRVVLLKSQGMSNPAIAHVLNISHPTLLKHFGLELETATAKMRAEVLQMLYREAEKGSVTAMRKLLANMEPLVPEPERSKRRPGRPKKEAAEKAEPKLGKKEAILQAAKEETKQGEWGDLLASDDEGTLQ